MVTLLLSDIHLGSPLSRSAELLKHLQHTPWDRLILIGDIFADLNFPRLNKDALRLLAYLRHVTQDGKTVIWIHGNHDEGLLSFLLHLAGIDVVEEFCWEWQGELCIAIHGHQFDSIVTRGRWIAMWASCLFLTLQRIRFVRDNVALLVDTVSSKLQWLTPRVAAGALQYGKVKGARYVFCGHTHESYEEVRDGVHYFNTGCWVGNVCSYVVMTDQRIQLIDKFIFDFVDTGSS